MRCVGWQRFRRTIVNSTSAKLEDSREAEEQIAFADVILLNKTDSASPQAPEEVRQHIRAINGHARLHETQNCVVSLERDRRA